MTEQLFEQCIRKIRQGDRDGLKQIYEAYIAYIYSIVYGVLHNKENAEDVTSEFFIRMWTTIADQYQFGNKHRTYLARIAHNMAIDFLRKNKKEDTTQDIQEVIDAGVTNTTITTAQESIDDSVIENMTIKEVIGTLKEQEQQILNIKIFGGLTFAEIAQVLKLPMGTVTWRYRTAIEKLRRSGYGKEVEQ